MAILAVGASDASGMSGLSVYVRAAEKGAPVHPVAACVVARGAGERIRAVCAVPPRIIARQIDACVEIARPGAAIAGMLARHQAVEVVAERISRREIHNVVLVPVLGREDGRDLLTAQGIKRTRSRLVPLAEVVIGEAKTLAALAGMQGAVKSSEALRALGARSVILLERRGTEALCRVFGEARSEFSFSVGDAPASALADMAGSAVAVALSEGLPVEAAFEALPPG